MKYIRVILACLLIGVSYNLFLAPYHLIPAGLIGLGAIISECYNINIAVFIAISNIVLLIISLPILGKEKTYKYLLPSFLIPVFVYITKDIYMLIKLESIEILILAISGAVLTGFAYSMIYGDGLSIGCFEIIQNIFDKTQIKQKKFLSYFLDFIIILLVFIVFDLESAVYTTIITLIITYFSTKSKIGISSNKSFFIITSKEKEVKEYLINELKYDYTEFNVRGGFTNQKNKIIMTVIDTKDYYRLREGIAIIDDKAFISIIDNYESINKNVAIDGK